MEITININILDYSISAIHPGYSLTTKEAYIT